MEALNVLVAAITGGIIMPVAQWVKKKLPMELGPSMPVLVALVNFGVVMGLAHFLAPEMTIEMAITLAFAGHLTGQTIHATVKQKSDIKTIEEKRGNG